MNIEQQDVMIDCADHVISQQQSQLDDNTPEDNIYVVTACHTCICENIQCEVRDALKRCASRHSNITGEA
jgi:hypothetical protein